MAASVVSALRWWARTKGDQDALVVAEDDVSYATLESWTSRFARRLAEAGVGPGDRVGLLGSNSLEWCVAALGILKTGAVLVPLNPRLVAAEVRKILTDADAKLVVADDAGLETLPAVQAEMPGLGARPLAEVGEARDGAEDHFVVDIDPADPAIVLFTSGTTGLSKGVICTNQTLLNIAFELTLTEEGLRPGSRSLLVLPLAFTPGLVTGLCTTTVLGGTLVVERSFDPGQAVRLLQKHKITAIFGVPLIFEAMAKSPDFAEADLSSIKTAITGGAPVPVPLLEAWGAKGVALRQIYGMTEVGGVATSTRPEDAAEHPGTCGTGSVFTEFKVIRADGTTADPGETGEVILRGPGVTPGYWQDEENTKRALRDGWLYSGDLGVLDDEGRLKFVDRMKDLIISGGINISPVEIEQVISGLAGVEEVAVISAKDEKFGETPAAILVTTGEHDPHSVIEHCGRELADFKVPRYVVFRDEPLPRLPSGKLAKVAIRREYTDIPAKHDKVR
ncbi:long-chain fatty acid--CoA ligase [Amycolatopsis acidicola]|uniref:Long-chain fatty acid--CoA ligase n=1 Tax=Amycolatopsis acidicola TaxID=2596893 RepID=A0A5N0UUK4_9PSEU|nr:AMP-binding protein [Amycolatopsis acidicola]KAA9153998.1 long-chain fatty acid--CoA ligase [Amycolatopsis acidicola]